MISLLFSLAVLAGVLWGLGRVMSRILQRQAERQAARRQEVLRAAAAAVVTSAIAQLEHEDHWSMPRFDRYAQLLAKQRQLRRTS